MKEILLVHTESTEITENNKYIEFTQEARKSRGNDFMNEILIRSIHFKSPAEIKEIKEKAAIAAYKFL